MRQTTPCPPCPDRDCQQPHVVRNGHTSAHQRYHCLGCGAWFGETAGTPLYRRRTPPEEIANALLIVMRRGGLRAAEEVTGHNYETIGRWLHLAARHAEALTRAPVHDLHLPTVGVDEFWSFVRRRTAPGHRPIRRRMGRPPR
jgi:transposase-like protein